MTIAEIARLADVKPATVSRVINNSGYVAKETKERVERVIKETGYRPNMLAHKLRTNKSGFVGLIIPDIANDFFSRLAKSIERTLQEKNIALFLCNSEEDIQKENFYINTLLDNQVEAVILTPASTTVNERLLSSGIPIVFADRLSSVECENSASITSDNKHGGALVAEKLLALGCKDIIAIRDERDISSAANDRIAGFTGYLEAHGASCRIYSERVDCDASYQRMARILDEGLPVDGIFCTADTLAIGALKCLSDKGKDVPGEIQLIGFDGFPIGPFLQKGLTTVVQDVEMMGKRIGETVIAMTNGGSYEKLVIVPVTLEVRESTRF